MKLISSTKEPDFDVEDIVSQFTYAVGYLQCGMINEFDEQEEE